MKNAAANPRLRVGLISLGCAKNLVDAEIMLGSLIKDGIEITNEATEADVVIVNTCSFIDAAQEESVDTILQSAQVREAHHRGQGLVVAGCLPQRFKDELPKLLPEVDAFMGIDQVAQVSDIVRRALAHRSGRLESQGRGSPSRNRKQVTKRLSELNASREAQGFVDEPRPPAPEPATPLVEVHGRPSFIPDFATPRFRLTPKHFAYVKIAEGCNHPCSFCIIPQTRGGHRSRQQHDIVAEARELLASGVKELNLISQDSTYYGLDLRPTRTGSIAAPAKFNAAARALPEGSTTLCTLLQELNALPGDFWIRLLYTHPAHWTDELIATIASCSKVARYVDMPLQHIHDNMLERMRRETSRQYIAELIARIRAGIPGIALRTTFIVGFPGETEHYFQSLLDFIATTRFERLGVFAYSQEESTRAGKMAGQISPSIKQQRREKAMATQQKVARDLSRSWVGRTMKVLVESATDAKDLAVASTSSWEHGLIRSEELGRDILKGRLLVARGEADAPDIDGRVYVRGRFPLGEFQNVRIVGATDYDLLAEPDRAKA